MTPFKSSSIDSCLRVEGLRSSRLLIAAATGVVSLCSASALFAQSPWPAPKVKPVAPAVVAPSVPKFPATSPSSVPSTSSSVTPAPTATQPGTTKSQDHGHAAGTPVAQDAAAAKADASTSHQWSPSEIEQAQNACVALLKSLDVVAIGTAPMREGECGAPAPIELISVGKSPQVTFSPPVVVTCDMAAALHKWVTTDLQSLAKKHLGAPIIRIDTMSSYSCRTAYGRRMARLSEHGKANAVDIRAFLTAKASAADVLANWGPTERDVAAQMAAAKAAAQKQQTAQPSQGTPAQGQPSQGQPALAGSKPTTSGAPPSVADTSRPGITIGIPGAPGMTFPSSTPSAIGLSNGLPPANRLGGPKPPPAASAAAPAQAPVQSALRGTAAVDQTDGRMQFLKGAHVSACKIFGTVLGPEANNAHRNHFHVDMAKRTTLTSFCE